MPASSPRHVGRLVPLAAVLVVVALAATACSAISGHGSPSEPVTTPPAGAYTPALARNAEFIGQDPLTQSTVDEVATQDHYVTIAKFDENYDLAKQFDDVKRIVAAAKEHDNPDIKVLMYVNSAFWYDRNTTAWGQYADGFQSSWLLKDASGAPITFAGKGSTKADAPASTNGGSGATDGHVVDLSNPAYRAWLVSTVSSWMKAAPISGVFADSADLLVGNVGRGDVAGGTDWNTLLCGADATIGSDGNCARVDAWNRGLEDLLTSLTAAFAAHGGTVQYNGVAPSVIRTADRNQELFADAPTAANEDFCWATVGTETGRTTGLTSVTDDIAMMKAQAADGKNLVEITNYKQDSVLSQYGGYCVGAFLMGWQPGHDWLIFHHNYGDPLTGQYPQVPEIDLSLGSPTGQDTANGSLLTRSFQNGYVAVNTGTSSETVTLPQALTQFAGGKQGAARAAGSTVTVPAHSSDFFLDSSYVASL